MNAKQPGGLLDQWNLLQAATVDERLSRGDIAVLGAIIQRYMQRAGNAWASVEMLEDLSGMSRRQIFRIIPRLRDFGYLTVLERGRRGRSSVFVPNYSVGRKGDMGGTETEPDCFGDTDGTENSSLGATDGTETAGFGDTDGTPSYLPVPADRTGILVSSNSLAAPSAPPAPAAFAPDGAVAAGGGFDDFWQVYPRKHGKAKARAAWNRIDPSAALARRIIERAREWAAHYEKHGVDKKWQPEPANWLTGERWDEDLPIVHHDAKGAAIAKAKANSTPKRDVTNGSPPGKGHAPPQGSYLVDIVGTTLDKTPGSSLVTVKMIVAQGERSGEVFEHSMWIESSDGEQRRTGRKMFAQLCGALGLSHVDDTDEIRGRVEVTTTLRGITYVPANDNGHADAA